MSYAFMESLPTQWCLGKMARGIIVKENKRPNEYNLVKQQAGISECFYPVRFFGDLYFYGSA